jgi:hypothetical protein
MMIAGLGRSQEPANLSASRRATARFSMVCLAVLMLVFLTETGLHSVHHLSDDNQAAPCQWPACGTGHPVSADTQSTSVQPLLVATGLVVEAMADALRISPLSTRHERAPPPTS